MKKDEDYTNEECWMAAESGALAYSPNEQHEPVLPNYDKIVGVGPQSLEELREDLKQAEREMKDPEKWDTLESFLASFKQSHAAWFR